MSAEGYRVAAGHRVLLAARRPFDEISEEHGWSDAVTINCRRAPTIVLAGFVEGGRFARSCLLTSLHTAAATLSVERAAEILDALGHYFDNRPSRVDTALSRALADVSAGIVAKVEQAIRA
ncbi:hypothetical protein GCM10022222_09940 [Amycolatopsis ultiminotia]|uniref:NIF system FeS cluster assembly NifU N-terminal domain-containing protein n=2 Tax=Amycolatopsis ultiminotia TaxID=543629 RepID=A0ABP6V540_9PSEU